MTRKRSREESTAAIENAALRLFASRGYANTSLEHVATAAGFTKGAVYYYFKSKENLLLRVLHGIEERSIDKTIAAVQSRDGPVLDKMLEYSEMHGRWAAEAPDDLAILMLVSIETARAKSRIRKRVLRFYEKMETLLTNVIEQGKARGEVPADFATAEAVMVMMAHHDGNMLLWYRSGCDAEVGRMLTASSKRAVYERFGNFAPAMAKAASRRAARA